MSVLITNAGCGCQSILWATTALLVGTAVIAGMALLLTRKLERIILILPLSCGAYVVLFYASIPLGFTLLFNLVYFRIDSIILTVTRSTQRSVFTDWHIKFLNYLLYSRHFL